MQPKIKTVNVIEKSISIFEIRDENGLLCNCTPSNSNVGPLTLPQVICTLL